METGKSIILAGFCLFLFIPGFAQGFNTNTAEGRKLGEVLNQKYNESRQSSGKSSSSSEASRSAVIGYYDAEAEKRKANEEYAKNQHYEWVRSMVEQRESAQVQEVSQSETILESNLSEVADDGKQSRQATWDFLHSLVYSKEAAEMQEGSLEQMADAARSAFEWVEIPSDMEFSPEMNVAYCDAAETAYEMEVERMAGVEVNDILQRTGVQISEEEMEEILLQGDIEDDERVADELCKKVAKKAKAGATYSKERLHAQICFDRAEVRRKRAIVNDFRTRTWSGYYSGERLREVLSDMTPSGPSAHVYTLSDGTRVGLLERKNIDKSVFVSIDSFLGGIMGLDNTPYFGWQKQMLIDGKDLPFTIREVGDIADRYFEQGNRVFHLTSHGLVVPETGAPSNAIRIGGNRLDASQAGELILASLSPEGIRRINTSGKSYAVVLHCCKVGAGEDSFAAALSKILSQAIPGAFVVASPDIVEAYWAKGVYTERIATPGMSWKVFKDGNITPEGGTDYVSAIDNYMTSHE